MLAQVLLEQGKLSAQLAVVTEKLNAVPDHEQRLRALERARWPWPTVSALGALLAAGAAVAAYVHH
jgi:hypothetical protein